MARPIQSAALSFTIPSIPSFDSTPASYPVEFSHACCHSNTWRRLLSSCGAARIALAPSARSRAGCGLLVECLLSVVCCCCCRCCCCCCCFFFLAVTLQSWAEMRVTVGTTPRDSGLTGSPSPLSSTGSQTDRLTERCALAVADQATNTRPLTLSYEEPAAATSHVHRSTSRHALPSPR